MILKLKSLNMYLKKNIARPSFFLKPEMENEAIISSLGSIDF